jgi:hypothetical protein
LLTVIKVNVIIQIILSVLERPIDIITSEKYLWIMLSFADYYYEIQSGQK